jgi:WxcM-like protein
VPEGQTRAGHAVSCEEFLVVIQGACLLTAKGAAGEERHRLTTATGGVHVPAGVWVLLSKFEPNTILLVYASKRFDALA